MHKYIWAIEYVRDRERESNTMIVIEVRLPCLHPRLKSTSRGLPNSLIWQFSFGWRSNRYKSFLQVKIKHLQIFLLVKSNHTQSSYGWRLNLFNKWFVVYNNGSLKSSSIQYAHTNSVSRIWSIWLKKYFEEIYFQSRILNDLKI